MGGSHKPHKRDGQAVGEPHAAPAASCTCAATCACSPERSAAPCPTAVCTPRMHLPEAIVGFVQGAQPLLIHPLLSIPGRNVWVEALRLWGRRFHKMAQSFKVSRPMCGMRLGLPQPTAPPHTLNASASACQGLRLMASCSSPHCAQKGAGGAKRGRRRLAPAWRQVPKQCVLLHPPHIPCGAFSLCTLPSTCALHAL